jgi:hypothetical protein
MLWEDLTPRVFQPLVRRIGPHKGFELMSSCSRLGALTKELASLDRLLFNALILQDQAAEDDSGKALV